jgi:hypothetical protein
MTNTGPSDSFLPEIKPNAPKRSGVGGGSRPSLYDEKAVSLDYIRQLLLELRAIAARQDAGTLDYLLEISVLEAEECLKAHNFKTVLIE